MYRKGKYEENFMNKTKNHKKRRENFASTVDDIYKIRSYVNNDEVEENGRKIYDTSNVHELDEGNNPELGEIDRNNKFNNRFFDFQNIINNNSHLNDPVDNMIITNMSKNYDSGCKISDIYDDLTNSYDYKTHNLPSCNLERKII
jgi:hypothetical protein